MVRLIHQGLGMVAIMLCKVEINQRNYTGNFTLPQYLKRSVEVGIVSREAFQFVTRMQINAIKVKEGRVGDKKHVHIDRHQ